MSRNDVSAVTASRIASTLDSLLPAAESSRVLHSIQAVKDATGHTSADSASLLMRARDEAPIGEDVLLRTAVSAYLAGYGDEEVRHLCASLHAYIEGGE